MITGILSLLLAVVPALASGASLGPAPVLDVPQDASASWTRHKSAPTRDQVVSLYNNTYLPGNSVGAGWTGSVAACSPGTTTITHQQAVIDRINYYRALVDLPGVSLISGTLQATQVQAAALIMAANGSLSHSPPTNWLCYTADGAAGAGSSNLALGARGPHAIDLYIDDPGSGNTAAGHRRWILYPPRASMATGDVSASGSWDSNSLYVFGPTTTRPATPNGVAWPPAGYVPYQNMPSGSNRWSISYPGANFAAATVTITGPGGSIPVTYDPIANGYGDNTLVFKPTGFSYGAPAADTAYTVTVSGITGTGVPATIQYSVTVIDPSASVPTNPIASFSTTSVSFGSVALGSTSTSSNVRVTNTGGGLLSLSSIALGGSHPGDFNRTGSCANGTTLGAAQFCDMTMSFTPTAAGPRSGTLQVTHNAAGSPQTVTLSGTGTGIADGTPDPFSFAARPGVPPLADVVSGAVTITGLNVPAAITVSGGSYSVNGGAFTSAAGTITNGQSVRVRVAASPLWRTSASATLSIGGVTGAFNVQTGAPPAELNADSISDLLWFNSSSGAVIGWFGSATGYAGSMSPGSVGPGSGWTPLAMGDLNGDGRPDIVWRHSSGAVNVWLLQGSTVLPESGYVGNAGSDWTLVGVADFDGDGRDDLLWRNSTSGALLVWYMSGRVLNGSAPLPTQSPASGWLLLGLADVNGDGAKDLIWRNSSNGAVNAWLMYGTSVLAQSGQIGSADSSWTLIGTGDVNGDGRADLIWRNTSGAVNVWFMNATGTGYLPASGQIASLDSSWSLAMVGDFNGDGRGDLVWRSTAGHNVIWLMNGPSINGSASLPLVTPGAGWSIVRPNGGP